MRCWVLVIMVTILVGCGNVPSTDRGVPPADTTQSDTTVDTGLSQTDGTGRTATLLSAFFGLDNKLPPLAGLQTCRGAGGQDGMPVIFSDEVDRLTLQAGDFRVTSATGQTGKVNCVTLAPAADQGELRTALLIGEFGTAPSDEPVLVEVTGNIHSFDGKLNFKGARVEVTPLAPGPSLVLAEIVAQEQWSLGKEGGSWGIGSGCPPGTTQIVRVVWAGGVTRPVNDNEDDEVTDNERVQYQVTLNRASGSSTVVPFALGDLGDGDNNHLLCLDQEGTPTSVSFAAGYLVDPNDDRNPATSVTVR
jgi:uncharacterized protein YceK